MKLMTRVKAAYGQIDPRKRQYMVAASILAAGVGTFWLVLALPGNSAKPSRQKKDQVNRVVVNPEAAANISPLQVNPVDQWLGTAGKDLAQYKADKEAQEKINADRKAAESAMLDRLAQLEKREEEQRVAISANQASMQTSQPVAQPPVAATSPSYPPGTPMGPVASMGAGTSRALGEEGAPALPPPMIRVSLSQDSPEGGASSSPAGAKAEKTETVENYLPVSFVRAQLLGGIDAPTGGQAQSNPLPIMLRLLDNAILPNRYRSEVKECFVVASGYGDISSERAYFRTSNLSCVRHDKSVLEVKIDGNLYGEDGKLGLRGRLVTKQGQLLANALRAGIVGGIGQGFSMGGSSFTSSPFGTLATSPEGTGEQMRRGMAGGVGRALDNLANYYIRLAEQTFPVIEVDGGRQADIALTRGVRIPVTSEGKARIGGDSDEGGPYAGGGDEED